MDSPLRDEPRGSNPPAQPPAEILKRNWSELNGAAGGLEDAVIPITRFLLMIWLIRKDLHADYPLATLAGRLGFVRWFREVGAAESELPEWLVPDYSPAAIERHLARWRAIGGSAGGAVIQGIWDQRDDLQAAFDITTAEGRQGYHLWLVDRARVDYGVPDSLLRSELWHAGAHKLALKLLYHGRPVAGAPEDAPSERPKLEEIRPRASERLGGSPVPRDQWRSAGVNLVGYAQGELGLGEDARTATRALDGQGISVGVVNITRGLATRQKDHSIDGWLERPAEHRVNLMCASAVEMFNLFLELGVERLDGRYNIGYWPWELPRWPDENMAAFYFVDEVWASTQFIVDALTPRAPVPVRRMPLAVTLNRTERFGRAHFGLPDGPFLFLFTFDFNSFIARKNPFASLAAFQQAFPRGDEPVGLVIKVMNVSEDDPNWQKVRRAAQADPRIHILDRTVSRDEILSLVECCDSYLSLHRSEGFGRGPAEAMLLGKPVIVTDYSGTKDFCTNDTACLVDYELIPVGAEDYLFPEGQVWADASVEHAAQHMARLIAEPDFAGALGAAAQRHMETHHSLEAVGRAYAARLNELGLIP
ncbi:MAG: glycosyltransferase family 4 protein [Pseudomonadota bacterium]